MRRRSRKTACLLLLGILLVTCGFASKKAVNLRLNDGQLLIDLDAAIEEALIGHLGSPETAADTKKTEEAKADPIGAAAGSSAVIAPTPDEPSPEFILRIRDDRVIIDGLSSQFTDPDLLSKYLKNRLNGVDRVIVYDAYAEAHFYRAVLKALRGLQAEQGLTFEIREALAPEAYAE